MKNIKSTMAGVTLVAALSGCATTQEEHGAIEQLRSDYERLAAQPEVQEHASQRLSKAEQAIDRAEQAWREDEGEDAVDHYLYLADRRLAIAEETAALGRAEDTVQNAEGERRQVLLDIREAQAREAQARADRAESRAQELEARAQQSENRARELEQNLVQLESEFDSLKAERTEAGIVLTLQDILFDVNQAELSTSADSTLDRVAEFLNTYPDRQLEIKGYTDSTGASIYNQQLSEQRAQEVADALVTRGVDRTRINTEGYGAADPVASNDNPSGRQQNRRVEIVIENPQQESLSGL